MMRGPQSWSVAVRLADGTIAQRVDAHRPWTTRHWLLALPVIRGAAVLLESLTIGTRALNYSALMADAGASAASARDGEAPPNSPDPQKSEDPPDARAQDPAPTSPDEGKPSLGLLSIVFTVGLSVLLALLLFVAAPHFLSLALGSRWSLDEKTFLFHAIDGILKFSIFLGYVWGIGRIPEIKRVFAYHGAEHRAIYAYEASLPLEPRYAKNFPLWHPRCGTAFIFVLLTASVLFFAVLFPLFFRYEGTGAVSRALVATLAKTLLTFPLAGLSYEVTKLAAKPGSSPVWKALIYPGLLLQRLTTRETDDAQLEVAFRALAAVAASPPGPEPPLK
jgi:uncharacterized protein YqhQ